MNAFITRLRGTENCFSSSSLTVVICASAFMEYPQLMYFLGKHQVEYTNYVYIV